MRRSLGASLISFTLLTTACYDPNGSSVALDSNINWTGSGDYSAASSYRGLAVGLAGQDVILFDQSGFRSRLNDTLRGEFSGPYELTSIAQTFSLGLHEQSFIHGNRVGQTDNLDIFHTNAAVFGYYAHRISPSEDVVIHDGPRNYTISQICDMATPDKGSGWVLPYVNESHLFMSVRACEGSNCIGALIEVDFDRSLSSWSIKTTGAAQHAQIKRYTNNNFNNECMPLTATRWSSYPEADDPTEYLYLLDPSTDEIYSYKTNNILAGRVDYFKKSGSPRPLDITSDSVKLGDVHYTFVQTLWQNGTNKYITHHLASNGNIGDDSFLTENVDSATTRIQSLGRGFRNNLDEQGFMLTLGGQASVRKYKK